MLEALLAFDEKLLLVVNGWHTPFWDAIMSFVSGKLAWAPFYALILFFLFRKYHWTGMWFLLAIVLLITISDQVSASLFKPFVGRLRPCREEALRPLLHLVDNHCGGKYGFVSSHAANAFALACLISKLFQSRVWYFVMFAWALTVSFSRVYLGVHYPGDVTGGAVVGVLSGLLVFFLLSEFKFTREKVS